MKKEKNSVAFVARVSEEYAISVFRTLSITFVEVHLSNKLETETLQQIKFSVRSGKLIWVNTGLAFYLN